MKKGLKYAGLAILALFILSIIVGESPEDPLTESEWYIDLPSAVSNVEVLKGKWGDYQSDKYTGEYCKESQNCLTYFWNDSLNAVYDENGVLINYFHIYKDRRLFQERTLEFFNIQGREPDHSRETLKKYYNVLDDYEVSVTDKGESLFIFILKMNDSQKGMVATQNKLKELFDSYTGRNTYLELTFADEYLNDPGSYEHVESRYWPNDDGTFRYYLKYRANNAYGGVVTEEVLLRADLNNNIIEILESN